MLKNCLSFIIVAMTVLLFTSGCTTPDGNAEDGKRWYMMHNCYACHGPNGDDGKGPEIHAKDMGFRSFLSIVRDANSPIMPKFPEAKVSKQDVADMYVWLRTK